MKKKSKSKEFNSDLNYALEQIQNKVLWLAVYMVDYANKHTSSASGLKFFCGNNNDLSVFRVHEKYRSYFN